MAIAQRSRAPRERQVQSSSAGTVARLVAFLVLLVHPNRREDAMCYSKDYWLHEQKKAEEARARQERRAGVVDKMLDDANKQGDRLKDATPVTDVAPAK
jgi:hypothetical protein